MGLLYLSHTDGTVKKIKLKNKDRQSEDHSPAIKILLKGSNVEYVCECELCVRL